MNNNNNLINNEEGKKKENNDLNNEDKQKDEQSSNNIKLNIIFEHNGLKTNFICDKDMTVEQIIKMYNEKCNQNINKSIFLFNGQLLNVDDKRKLKDVIYNDNAMIFVVNK